jgi:hypothetical protein
LGAITFSAKLSKIDLSQKTYRGGFSMGLGFCVQSSIPARGIFHRKLSRDSLYAEIADAIRKYVKDPLAASLLSFQSQEHSLYVTLHPGAEFLEILWSPEQWIQVSAKTSTIGPGYHAFLIALLRHLETVLGLRWNWDEENADETDFAKSGDFQSLQNQMADFWKGICSAILSQIQNNAKNIVINWPLNAPHPVLGGFAATPLGPLSRECCEAILTGDHNTLIAACRRFFVWWDQEPDAVFWRNTGSMLLWSNVPWRIPDNKSERVVCQLALDCFHRALLMDSNISLPQIEMDELQCFLALPEDAAQEQPSEEGIGYYRRLMSHPLTGHWAINLPGYYSQLIEDDGTFVFWFGERTIRFSSFSVKRNPDATSSLQDSLAVFPKENPNSKIISLEKNHLHGMAAISPPNADKDRDYWMLHGKIVCNEDSIGLLTLCFDDPADKTWAVETFQSISHPPK